MVVLAGGIELYDLATTQVSTLYNVCEAHYLDDLSESESVELVISGLSKIGRLTVEEARELGKAVFSKVRGQPYLTQRLGECIAECLADTNDRFNDAVEIGLEILRNDDVLLRHLRGALLEYHLLEECEPLIQGNVRFSRSDENMARLELLGIATKGDNNNWVIRNSLFADEIKAWLKATRHKANQKVLGLSKSETIRHETSQQKGYSGYEHSVFISYAWGNEQEEVVNQIDQALQKMGIKIIRDKRDLGYKSLISEFMGRIGLGSCVIVVISDKYLRSPNCMFELVKIAEGKNFYDRIFPVVLNDANIYDPVKLIDYIKYWESKRAELAQAMKDVDPANLQGIRDDMDLYDRIRDEISGLTKTLKDMNTLTPDMHLGSNFHDLYLAIENRMRITASPDAEA